METFRNIKPSSRLRRNVINAYLETPLKRKNIRYPKRVWLFTRNSGVPCGSCRCVSRGELSRFFFMPWPSIGRSLGSTWWITCTVAFMGTFGPPMVLKRSKEKLRQKSYQFHHSRKCSRNTKRWRISKIFCFSAHRQGKPNLWVKSFCLHFFRLDLGFGDGVGTLGKKKTAVFSDGSNKWVYGMGSEAHELNNFRHFHMFSYIFIIWYYIYKYIIYIYTFIIESFGKVYIAHFCSSLFAEEFFSVILQDESPASAGGESGEDDEDDDENFLEDWIAFVVFFFFVTWQIQKKRSPRTGCNRLLFLLFWGWRFGGQKWWKSHGEIRQKDSEEEELAGLLLGDRSGHSAEAGSFFLFFFLLSLFFGEIPGKISRF